MKTTTFGLDLAKRVFQVHWVDMDTGEINRRQFKREHDAVVADQLLRIVSKESKEAVAGAAFARGYLASHVAADHQTLRKLWKRFRRLVPPH